MFHNGYPPYGAPAPQQHSVPPMTHFHQQSHQAGPSSLGQPNQQMMFAHGQHHMHQQPPQAPFGQSMPAQSPNDPAAFAHMFKSHLASLTFNSKPIITNLTVIAHDNAMHMAPVVAQCLDEHIMTAPPPYRLPALYTLDSICKNVGSPYTELWAERIVVIFMDTYRVVDHAIKVRMEELLNTWRHSGPNQTPLFGVNAQQHIERALWGPDGPPQNRYNHAHQSFTGSPAGNGNGSSNPPNIQSMLSRFDTLLSLSTHNQQHAPHLFDATRFEALTKLRSIVASTSLSPADLEQIAKQLDTLESEMQSRTDAQARSPLNPLASLPAGVGSNGYGSTPPIHHQHNASSSARSPLYPTGGASASAIPPSLAGVLANLGKLKGNLTPPSHQSTPPPSMMNSGGAQRPNAALDLVASLRQAGLLPASNSQSSAPAQDDEYCRMIKGLDIKAVVADLQREVPMASIEAITVKELSLQCRQCASRFPAGAQGQASLDRHLDWHFRQNRKAKESAVRGQSRSWFTTLGQWIRGGHDDVAPVKSDAANGASQNGVAGNAALTPAQEAELKAATKKFVVAPSDDPEAGIRPCPICNETFKSEWSEDEEEWIWKNCIKVNGKYYHASCHYSAQTLANARSALSASQRSGDSRDGTPPNDAATVKGEPQSSIPTPDTAVVAKQEGDSVKHETSAGDDVSATAPLSSPAPTGTKRKSSQMSSGADVETGNDDHAKALLEGHDEEPGSPPASKRIAVA